MTARINLLQAAFQHALAWTGSALALSLGYITLIGHHLPTGDTLFLISALLDIAAIIGACVGVIRVRHMTRGAKPITPYAFRRRMLVADACAAIRVRRPVYVLR
jgi:hypothetical protein